MVRRSKRIRFSSGDVVSGGQLSLAPVEVVEEPVAMSSDYVPVTPMGAGPANWVDPVTYRRIRSEMRRSSGTKRRKTTRASSRKRSYRRPRRFYGGSGGGYSRNLNGMGPIVITGRGGYWADKFKAAGGALYRGMSRAMPEGTFSRLGGAVGGSMFGKYGQQVGSSAGQLVAGITGMGAYNVNQNSLLLPEGSPVPTFANMSQATVVCHREYIKDIVGPAVGATFTLDSFPINPGNPKTFPWLSQIAANYDQYAILGMIFEYKSTSSDSLNTGVLGLGTVILSTDYDSADVNYSSKIEMENSQFCITTKPPEDALHPIECDPAVGFNEIKYLRGISVPTGKDVRLYDHGNFQIATIGLPNAAGSIGELWVTYQVAFYKPQFLVQGQGSITDMFTLANTRDNANKFTSGGLVQAADVGSSIGGTVQTNTYTFPTYIQSGKYMIHFASFGGATALVNQLTFTNLVNCVGTAVWDDDTIDTLIPYVAGAVQTVASLTACITVTGGGASFQTGVAGTIPGPVIGGNVFIMSIDKNA